MSSDDRAIAISATFTAEAIEAALAFWAGELALPYEIRFAAYNQLFQELLAPASLFASNRGFNVALVRLDDWLAAGVDESAHRFIDAVKSSTAVAPLILALCPPAPGHEAACEPAVRLIREALPTLKSSGRGRIVNLTGYGVKEPMTDLVVSDSVRAGVTVMAKTIASDLAPHGITVNNIAPGPIMTDRLTEILSARARSLGITPDAQFKRFAETIPVRRMGRPNEIGDLCAYLCSPQAGYITGQTIVVDGGINRSI